MEPYVRENTGKFPLSSLAEETTKGVGITGVSRSLVSISRTQHQQPLERQFAVLDLNKAHHVWYLDVL